MKQFLKQWIGVIFSVASFAAPAPYPLTINSRSQTAPPVTAYRGNEMTYRVSFVDGSTSSAIADDETPFMSWATNASAEVIGTSIYSRVSGQTGVVDFTFSPSVLNYDQGRYIYEAGVISSNGNYMVYRQGTFSIYASPVGGGANPFIGTTNIIWGMYNWLGIPDWITADYLPDYSVITAHIADTDNPHTVTAAQLGALTNETDTAALAALAAHSAYWPPNATASSWFTFITNSGAITITGYNIAGGTDVVIPDYINGWPVTTIGVQAFMGRGVKSIGGAGNVVTVGDSAFISCDLLASVSLPQVQTVGHAAFVSCTSLTSVLLPQAQTVGGAAFSDCSSLTSVPLPQARTVGGAAFSYCTSLASLYFDNDVPTIGADIFVGITENQVTIYVTNPTATGWGDELGDMPVVRLPLHGDEIYKSGLPVATEAHVAQAIAEIPVPDLSDHPTFSQIAASNALPYTAWTGTITPADGTATVTIAHGNMPVLVIDAPCVLTLDPTGFGTAGVSRVSLSYYPGTNSFTFATNVISYAETPTVSTNGWNTLLLRRVSDGAWKGVGL